MERKGTKMLVVSSSFQPEGHGEGAAAECADEPPRLIYCHPLVASMYRDCFVEREKEEEEDAQEVEEAVSKKTSRMKTRQGDNETRREREGKEEKQRGESHTLYSVGIGQRGWLVVGGQESLGG